MIASIARRLRCALGALIVVSCGNGADGTVTTTGKIETRLEDVPAEVLSSARESRPDLELQEAEYEVRAGRAYYDLEGILPDGKKIELDLTFMDGSWTVVEVQRDVGPEDLEAPVREALAGAQPGWEPHRIIESDQGSGLVIYEFFGPGEGGERKVEVKWEDGEAEVLQEEWVH